MFVSPVTRPSPKAGVEIKTCVKFAQSSLALAFTTRTFTERTEYGEHFEPSTISFGLGMKPTSFETQKHLRASNVAFLYTYNKDDFFADFPEATGYQSTLTKTASATRSDRWKTKRQNKEKLTRDISRLDSSVKEKDEAIANMGIERQKLTKEVNDLTNEAKKLEEERDGALKNRVDTEARR